MSNNQPPDETETLSVPGPVVADANAQTTDAPRKRRRRGQPPEPTLTPGLCDRICAAVAKGLFPAEAAALAGVHATAFKSWLKKGAKGIEPFTILVAAIEQAEAALEASLLGPLVDAGSDRTRLDVAGRRFPHRWSDHAARRAVFGLDGVEEGISFSIEINIGGSPPITMGKSVAIPEVTADDARAIERAAPSTKV